MTTIDVNPVLDALVSHALTLGRFEQVNKSQPDNAPGHGLTAAYSWVSTGPVPAGSGLSSTTGLVIWEALIFSPADAQPQDAIDPELVAATHELIAAYAGHFTLGGLIRQIDVLGQTGTPLRAAAGYVEIGEQTFRVSTITIPTIINDLFDQGA